MALRKPAVHIADPLQSSPRSPDQLPERHRHLHGGPPRPPALHWATLRDARAQLPSPHHSGLVHCQTEAGDEPGRGSRRAGQPLLPVGVTVYDRQLTKPFTWRCNIQVWYANSLSIGCSASCWTHRPSLPSLRPSAAPCKTTDSPGATTGLSRSAG